MNKFLLVPILLCFTFAACAGAPKDDDILEVQTVKQIMKTGKDIIDPVHGKQVKLFYGALSGVGEANANGVAFIHVFEDGASIITANLNIALAPAGQKYVAYAVGGAGGNALTIGEFTSVLGDVRHAVRLETPEDASSLLSINVRLEGKGQPTLVAEGTLKAPPPTK